MLFDITKGRRVREYRFEDTPVGNGGVAQSGGYFAAINYARMAGLRPVTGYKGAFDWTEGDAHPKDDRREDGAHIRTAGFDIGNLSGDLRQDPSPCWNRDGTKLLVPGVAGDGTRQLFVLDLRRH